MCVIINVARVIDNSLHPPAITESLPVKTNVVDDTPNVKITEYHCVAVRCGCCIFYRWLPKTKHC
jgi:hypothetical protein